MFELTGLAGKVAVVTGAGRMRSIGRPIAVELARAGCDIVLTGTGKPVAQYPPDEQEAGWRDIESVADEVRAHGRRALTAVSDVADPASVEELADRVEQELGRCDIVVNNAGAARGNDRVPVHELPVELWHKILHVNLDGTFYVSRTFAQRMLAAGTKGSIVQISSIAGRMLSANTAAYASSKAAIQALACCMAKELGPHGIRVNTICPGLIDTSRMDDMDSYWDQAVNALVPLKRGGTGEDIANMVVYLCSDQGAWITGETITIDGGHVGMV